MDDLTRAIRYPFDTAPDHGEAVEVAEGALWMRLPLPMALNHVNCYALDDGDGWTVVDTGFDTRKTRGIWESLFSGPLNGKPVTRVLVTHHHPDHIGLAGWFQESGAGLTTTRTAWLFARMLSLDVQERASDQAIAFWRQAGMRPDLLEARKSDRPFNFADVITPLPLGFTRIKEGDEITVGGRRWIVRCGNGHSPEHATLWSMDDNLVIGGDQLLPSISPNLGVYPTEPEADPVAEWLDSCLHFQGFAEDRHLVLPGHKLPFAGLPFRLEQLIENHRSALARLEKYLKTPHTATDCFQTLFKREIGESEYGLALVEAMSHCLHLWHQGRVTRELGKDGAYMWTSKEPEQ